jgi:hypothetical protein
MNRSKCLIGGLLIGALVLGGCQKQQPAPQGQVNGQAAVDEQVNKFLTEKGITLAPGAGRAALSGPEGSGIASMDKSNGTTTYSVIADLPPLTGGMYAAWLKNEAGAVVNLGQLKQEKGGYMVTKTTTEDWSSYKTVIVSQETGTVTTPTGAVLQGNFP